MISIWGHNNPADPSRVAPDMATRTDWWISALVYLSFVTSGDQPQRPVAGGKDCWREVRALGVAAIWWHEASEVKRAASVVAASPRGLAGCANPASLLP
jgi:hypothetical protein